MTATAAARTSGAARTLGRPLAAGQGTAQPGERRRNVDRTQAGGDAEGVVGRDLAGDEERDALGEVAPEPDAEREQEGGRDPLGAGGAREQAEQQAGRAPTSPTKSSRGTVERFASSSNGNASPIAGRWGPNGLTRYSQPVAETATASPAVEATGGVARCRAATRRLCEAASGCS